MENLTQQLGIVKQKKTRLLNEGRNNESVNEEFRKLTAELYGWKYLSFP